MNDKGQCLYQHPRKCIYFETRGCKKGNNCDFYHTGNEGKSTDHSDAQKVTRNSNQQVPQNRKGFNRHDKGNYNQSDNKKGARNHSNARHVDRDSKSSSGPAIDMAFLGETMLRALKDHLEKVGQDNNNNNSRPKKWPVNLN